MTLIDFIGFLISFFALIFLFFRTRYEKSLPLEEEEESELPEDHPLKEYLEHLKEKVAEQETPIFRHNMEELKPAKPAKTIHSSLEKRKLKSPLAEYKLKSSLAERKIETRLTARFLQEEEHRQAQIPRIVKIMKKLHSDPRNILVYYEIMGKPKGL